MPAIANVMTTLLALLALVSLPVVRSYPNCTNEKTGNDFNRFSTDDGIYNGYEGYRYQGDDFVQNWYPGSELPSCTSATENLRGHYTSNLAPCEFRFHKIDTPDTTGDYVTSSLCGDDNVVGVVWKEYVNSWRDECVGDFNRCYIIARDEKVFLDFACYHELDFPEGSTHLSVSCVEDKSVKLEYMEQNPDQDYDDVFWKRQKAAQQKRIRELEAIVFSVVAVLIVSCSCCCVFSYCFIWKPYHETLNPSEQDTVEISGLVDNEQSTESSTGENGLSAPQIA